jgi:hypothetical protein
MSRLIPILTDDPEDQEVCYLQSQNGNVWDRYRNDGEGDDADESPELAKFQEWVLKGPKVMQALGKRNRCSKRETSDGC